MIEHVTAANGRTGELDPGSVFASLKDIRFVEPDEDDVDPRQAFQNLTAAFTSANRREGTTRRKLGR